MQLADSPNGGVVGVVQPANASSGFIRDRLSFSAVWSGFDAGSSAAAVSYEVCVGSTPYSCQLRPHATTTVAGTLLDPWRAEALSLPCDASYYATVRATNCAGLQRIVASSAAKLCCFSPLVGVVRVADFDGVDIVFATNTTEFLVQWDGFEDHCSGIHDVSASTL